MTVLCTIAFGTSDAHAFWTAGGSGSGTATTSTLPAPAPPSASVTGDSVTVSFSQVTVEGVRIGATGGHYTVLRYPAGGGAAVTPGGDCGVDISGSAATLSCTETSTPPGEWLYTVTPTLLGWSDTESSPSAAVIVNPAAPASLTATAVAGAEISLGWSAVSGTVGYNIYRRISSGSYNYSAPLNGGTPLAATSMTDATAVSGTSYFYTVRAVALGGSGQQIESVDGTEAGTTADGDPPTGLTLSGLSTYVRGSVSLTGTASDAISGVATVVIEYKLNSGSSWTTACSFSSGPYSCSFDTATASDGLYDFRLVATDDAGNQAISAVTTSEIDNTVSSVSFTAPSAYVRQTIALSATASDTGSGVAGVVFEYKLTSGSSWSTACSDTTSPYTCNFDTTVLIDGSHDFRATATDNAGNQAASSTAASTVDNTVPTAADVQTANGGGTLRRPTTGDTVTYSFSEPVQPTSILAGWTGVSTTVTLRLNQAATDTMTVYNAANTALLPLGSTTIGTQFVTGNRRFTGSTMVMSGNTITITLGTRAGGGVATGTVNVAMVWTPSTTVTDLAGNPMSATACTETGAADIEF